MIFSEGHYLTLREVLILHYKMTGVRIINPPSPGHKIMTSNHSAVEWGY